LGGGAPEYTFAVIWSNTTNTLTLQPSKMVRLLYAPFLTFYDGDTYQFSASSEPLTRPGWVRALNHLQRHRPWDSTPTPIPRRLRMKCRAALLVGQHIEWAIVNLDNHGYFNLVENRDFYNGIAKPDYVPLADPYPQRIQPTASRLRPTNSSPIQIILIPPLPLPQLRRVTLWRSLRL